MNRLVRLVAVLVLAAASLLATAAPGLAGSSEREARPLVTKLRADNLGATVLARGDRQALYYWNRERDGRVRCVSQGPEPAPPPAGPTPTPLPGPPAHRIRWSWST